MNEISMGQGMADPTEFPVAVSRVMQEVTSNARDVAETETTVLLVGENGTGKEILGRFIHRGSARARGPLVIFSCAAHGADAVERELFGDERQGEVRPGAMERAHGGTLLLDEVSELPLPLQAKLLRFLQERQVVRAGGGHPVDVDVRLVATSSVDLRTCVASGQFRRDLYYRLCVFPIVIPPLRERRADIAPLAAFFVEIFSRQMGRPTPALSGATVAALERHAFSGNVRELRNLIERAVIGCRHSVLQPDDLRFDPEPLQPDVPAPEEAVSEARSSWDLPIDLGELERLAIGEALRRVGGNRTHAARLLGISLRTLRNKLKVWRESGKPLSTPEAEAAACHERDAEVARSSQSSAEEQAA